MTDTVTDADTAPPLSERTAPPAEPTVPKQLRYIVSPDYDVDIRPSPSTRDWMLATNQGFAKRCLPLTIANSHSWELLNPVGFTARWEGSQAIDGVALTADDGAHLTLPMSHFGHGILTFGVPGLLVTPPGWDLWVVAPINHIKDGVQGLTGIVETDWSHFSFTMNWQFTRPGTIRFEKGEPFLAVHPIPRGATESFDPVLVRPTDGGAKMKHHDAWTESRLQLNQGLTEQDEDAIKRGWQKEYTKGPTEPQTPPHRTKLKLRAFRQEGSE